MTRRGTGPRPRDGYCESNGRWRGRAASERQSVILPQRMFTFGRDHEKACSVTYLHDKAEAPRIHGVIDAVHDFLDKAVTEAELRRILYQAFSEGGGGVWEQTDLWIRKLLKEYPSFSTLWSELSQHSSWKVRWRTACCLDSMPPAVAQQVANRLRSDASRKVREMAADRMGG